MQQEAEEGRRLVVAIIVVTLTMSVLVIVTFNILQGPHRLPQQLVRFALTIGLCVFLYRGANWARWVTGVLFALAGPGSLVAGVVLLASGTFNLFLLLLGAIYSGCAFILFFVPTVKAFFRAGAETTA